MERDSGEHGARTANGGMHDVHIHGPAGGMDLGEAPGERSHDATNAVGILNQPQADELLEYEVYWYSERGAVPVKAVRIEILSHSLIADAILETISQINDQLKNLGQFELLSDPSLYSMFVADDDQEPELPGNPTRDNHKHLSRHRHSVESI